MRASAFHKQQPGTEEFARAREKLDAYVGSSGAPYYAAMGATRFSLELKARELEFYWGQVNVLYDLPEKSQGETSSDKLLVQLRNMLGKVNSDLLIVS